MTTAADGPPEWLDVMPAIPLAKGVPVLDPDGVHGVALHALKNRRWLVFWEGGSADEREAIDPKFARVDLAEPQGFGYALSWLQRKQPIVGSTEDRAAMRLLWCCGVTTDADRLSLARACAEVQR